MRALLIALLIALSQVTAAQELELRAYANTPIRINTLSLLYSNSGGLVWLDPALQIDNLDADTRIGIVSYQRTFGVLRRNARFSLSLPWADGSWRGTLAGEQRSGAASGTGDMRVGVHWNFKGAPAATAAEFPGLQPQKVIGASAVLTMPTGDYDPDKLLNLGSNRWSLRTEIGTSLPFGPHWSAEFQATAWWFGDNDNFFNGRELKQEQLLVLKGSFNYSFAKPGLWAGFGVGFGTGGTTIVESLRRETRQENWRFAFTLSYPIARQHGIGILLGSGITRKAGADFDSVRLLYRYTWGG